MNYNKCDQADRFMQCLYNMIDDKVWVFLGRKSQDVVCCLIGGIKSDNQHNIIHCLYNMIDYKVSRYY